MRFPTQLFSDYSIQKAFGHIDEYVKKAGSLGLPALCITDYNSVSGCIEFLSEIKKYNELNANKIKPILGATLHCYKDDKFFDVVCLCKNKSGWYELVKLISLCRSKETIQKLSKECVTYDDITACANVIIVDQQEFPVLYADRADEYFQKIIACSAMKCTLADSNTGIQNFPEYGVCFNGENLSLERDWSDKSNIYKSIEDFDIADKPKIPSLIEDGVAVEKPGDYLIKICRNGWYDKKLNLLKDTNIELYEIYGKRVKDELQTITGAGLANYMLLIRDIVMKCKIDGKSVNIRGSAVGSLVSYLSGISNVDPVHPDPTIPYDARKSLIFERFINKGRISEGRIALPDIDIDIPPDYLDELKEWIKNKYGNDRVANIITFQEMKGAAAIKEVFRVLDRSFDVANSITKGMVSEARVQDELEDIKVEKPGYTIINYCIDHIPAFSEYYNDFKHEIDVAIRLSNTIRSEGRHAAGIVLASETLTNFAPVKYDDKSDNNIISFRMQDVEEVGGVKFDLLSVQTLKNIDEIKKLIKERAASE